MLVPKHAVFILFFGAHAWGLGKFFKNTRTFPECSLSSRIDFYKSFDVLGELNISFQLMLATPRIGPPPTATGKVSNCSATVVSDTGSLLTASHCITGGGSVLNNDFELVGVLSGSLSRVHNNYSECTGGTFAIPTKEILNTLRKEGINPEQALRCERKKVQLTRGVSI